MTREPASPRITAGRSRAGRWGATLATFATVLVPLVCGALLTLADLGGTTQLRNLLFDQYQRIEPRVWRDDLPVRIVDIDDASLARFGQWPWPRDLLARLTQKLAAGQPAAIVFDILFAEPDRYSARNIVSRLPPSAERDALARVIAQAPDRDPFAAALAATPSVLALVLTSQETPDRSFPPKAGFVELGDRAASALPTFDHVILPLVDLRERARGLGAINYTPDRDLVVRKAPLAFALGSHGDASLVPSLDAEALRLAQGTDTIILKATGASGERSFGGRTALVDVRIGEAQLATEKDGAVRVRFAGHQPARFIPAWKIIEDAVPASELEGRILFVGTSAAALADLRTTPVDTAVPGVEIHAEMIEHAVTGAQLSRPDYAQGFEAAILLVAAGLAALCAALMRPLPAFFAAAVLVIGIFVGSWYAFTHTDLLLDPLLPGGTTLAAFGAMTLRVYRRSERDRKQVREAFSRYLAPAVVERLAADPSRLRLGGEARVMTMMFCDARDFTARAETLDAESVVSFLNALHTPLTAAVLAEMGTIDKFVGDGLMAFWNAPLDVPDHATRACAAALAMIEAIPDIDARMAGSAGSGPADRPPRVSIGIGINTGEAFVGNMGSEQRFDYSVVGDAVNIAARLETATKDLRVPIIVSDATRTAARGFLFVDLGVITLRGRAEPMRIHALHARDNGSCPDFEAFAALHARALGGDAQALAQARAHPQGLAYADVYTRLS